MNRLTATLLLAGLTTGLATASAVAQDQMSDPDTAVAQDDTQPVDQTSQQSTGPATQSDPSPSGSAPDGNETQAQAPQDETQAPPQPGPRKREMAESREDAEPGENYVLDDFSDWTLRCVKIEEVEDPCELHQTLEDQAGTRTAEINLFPLDRPGIAAGATIVTPLETLLTRNITLSVDGGDAKAYPFTFCNRIGCVSQVAFTADEIAAFKRGRAANLVIVPVAAPDQKVELTVSLAGFTAAYEKLTSMPQP